MTRTADVVLGAGLVAGVLFCGCDVPRELTLVPALPRPCGGANTGSLSVRGLGDFAPTAKSVATSATGAVDLALSLQRNTRVITLSGVGGASVPFGRTAPLALPALWSDAHVASIVYGPPDTFCDTASMVYARAGHRATLLDDGTVVLTGGINRDGYGVAPIERYLPAGDASSPIARFELADQGGTTLDARSVLGHGATVMNDGRVLLTGGVPAGASTVAFEGAVVLDALGRATGKPLLLGGGPRAYHASVALADGTILLTGGCLEVDGNACATGRTLDTAVLYDPATDAFTDAPTLTVARAGHAALLRSDGLVLLVGGNGADGSVPPVELYDPSEQRGSLLTGPVGHAVRLDSGLVIGVNDAAGPSAVVSAWSGRDDATVALPSLPTSRSDGTLTALEDGSVLFAGGWDGASLASTSVVLGGDPLGPSTLLSGFLAHGHTATRLLDGTVLLAGGSDLTGMSSAHASVFLRSLRGPFDTPATFDFGGGVALSPSRADHVSTVDGALVVSTDVQGDVPLVDYALVAGPELAGPSAAGFSLSVLAGRKALGTGTAALLFGAPASGRYVAVRIAANAGPTVLVVAPDRAGRLDASVQPGCDASVVADGELPAGGLSAFTLTARDGRIELHTATRRVLRCSDEGWPGRGMLGVGAADGVVVFDNVAILR
ncbi:MAG: kelch repeat-containing protein [Polyangia bacterium]